MPELLKYHRWDDLVKTDADSVLLLRLLHIMWLAFLSGKLLWAFLEHPEDPAKTGTDIPGAENCSSIWAVAAITTTLDRMGARYRSLDQ